MDLKENKINLLSFNKIDMFRDLIGWVTETPEIRTPNCIVSFRVLQMQASKR